MQGAGSKHTANPDTLISIIIVTYNAAKTLQQCLDSIYAQTYPAIEIIVIDGKSTDDTVAILQANAPRLAYWKSEPDEGIYHAMNKGIKHVKGAWLYFLGADDELLPGFSDMAGQLKDATAIYYANVFANGKKRLGKLNRYQFAKFGPYHQAMIYPREVFDRYEFDLRYKISADFALTLKLIGDRAFHFVYLDHTIARFNHMGVSGTQIDMPFQKDKGRLIYENFGLKIWLRFRIRKLKSRNNPRA